MKSSVALTEHRRQRGPRHWGGRWTGSRLVSCSWLTSCWCFEMGYWQERWDETACVLVDVPARHAQRRPSAQGEGKRRERRPTRIHGGWEMHTRRDGWLGGKQTNRKLPLYKQPKLSLQCWTHSKLAIWFFTGYVLLINDFISFTILVSLLNSFCKEDKNWGPSSSFSPPESTWLGLKARSSPFWPSLPWIAALLWPHPHLWALSPPCGFSRDDSLVCKTSRTNFKVEQTAVPWL